MLRFATKGPDVTFWVPLRLQLRGESVLSRLVRADVAEPRRHRAGRFEVLHAGRGHVDGDRDAEVAAPWLANEPADRWLLPVADAFEVSRRIIMGMSAAQPS